MNTVPFLECNSVSKSFGRREQVHVLSGVSFAVSEGEQVCITGSSGSGKTTLLTIMGGLQRPSSGEVKIQGRSLAEMSSREAARLRAWRIGFVFQSPALVPVLSASENVEYALRLARPELDGNERRKLVSEALEVTNLGPRKHLRPGELSGGECQRVAIARAVVKRPSLVLADEPTSNLDDDNAATISMVFRQLQAHHRSTIVIASHDARILPFSDRVLRLHGYGDGKLGDAALSCDGVGK